MALLEIENLSTGYGGAPIVKSVSLHGDAGKVTAILGPNGAGKSTLLKAIAGELRWDGIIRLKGEVITGLPGQHLVRRGLGYVAQTRDVFPSLTVRENLEIGGYTLSRKVRVARLASMIDRFPVLGRTISRAASTLSGGERKILGIGRVLMTEPDLLLLDEPTAGLAPQVARNIREHIRSLATEERGVVMVEQQAVEALRMADRGYILVAGEVRHVGSAEELLCDSDIGAMFLGK